MECRYCKKSFATKVAYDRHRARVTACVSWKEMDDMMADYDDKVAEYEHKLEMLSAQFAKALSTIKEKSAFYEQIIVGQKDKIAELTAKQLVLEEVVWEKVTVVAPFMSNNSKKSLKGVLKDIKDEGKIKAHITKAFPNIQVAKIVMKKRELEVVLEDMEASECKICFENKVQVKPRCKTCKVCYICESCELAQIKQFHRCAFCNTEY